MPESRFNPWLHRFAVLTALATLALLGVGGLVTSHGVGMAVPDWPNTYGYNMFLFPPSKWVGGIFYEHTHRLVASGVGLLTAILAGWLWLAESRRWLRWLGVIAFYAVVLQGVLGGLRVVLFKDQIGIFHAALAQLFFALICALALLTSRWWLEPRLGGQRDANEGRERDGSEIGASLRRLFLATTTLIFLQLILGATMRHQHAGLAIPDFPLAYGKLWPAMDAEAVAAYNSQRLEVTTANPITATQIALQMAHRLVAVVILVCAGALAWRVNRTHRHAAFPLRRLTFLWFGLILFQAGLGAWTIWSQKAADVATAHVLVGALSLVTGVFGCIICFRHPEENASDKVASTFEVARRQARFSAIVNQ
ncbi:MAG: COX15/CtaA family protein [Verrucomicrobia subdivision 3 bacterium]|nr:COX15/CtaA family protein [Limisphaerales bacterium]